MTDEEITQLAQKIKDGLASEEEKTLFFKEFNSLIDSLNGDLEKIQKSE
ncbi:hypothetical protein IPF86_02235 [Candidatus Nomurabacteria bacterium]|jgi:ribonuclease HIII|nr:MAG: hypothetical protein IPF86_02235 [Candidatus Nomurabacteria bacterium]